MTKISLKMDMEINEKIYSKHPYISSIFILMKSLPGMDNVKITELFPYKKKHHNKHHWKQWGDHLKVLARKYLLKYPKDNNLQITTCLFNCEFPSGFYPDNDKFFKKVYSTVRVERWRIMDENERKVLECIRVRKGCALADIARILRMDKITLLTVLQKLEDNEKIYSRHDNKKIIRCYYPK